jgi:hypothetical protein
MIAGVLLLLAVLVYRVVLALGSDPALAGLNNFSPIGALVLCGAAFLPRKWAVALPVTAIFLSDLVLNAHYRVSLLNAAMLPNYLAFALIAALGWMLRGKAPGGRIFAASIAGSIIFYVVTNTAAWLVEPQYAKSAAGWVQALTVGLPAYGPTWHFFRNTLLSDLAFTGLFVACLNFRPAAPAPARVPASA